MSIVLVVAAGAAGWAAATADPPRKFGPEWTLVGGMYERAAVVRVRHSPGGNVSGYLVPLEDGEVRIDEVDDKLGYTFRDDTLGLTVRKDGRGQVTGLTVGLKANAYYDLDDDGMIDALIDQRDRDQDRKVLILLDGRLVRVRDSKVPFFCGVPGRSTALAYDDVKVEYVFEAGAWKKSNP